MDWIKKLFGKKKDDSVFEVIEVLQTINNRKLKHLHDCMGQLLAANKIQYAPPATFVTDLEIKILERMSGEKAEQIKKLVLRSFEENNNG